VTEDAIPDAVPDAVPARRAAATDIALVGTGAALVAVCSLLAIPVGTSGVPITLQTFGVLLVGALLGSRRGAFAVLLYLLVGFAGLPVFAEGTGGLATFAKPSVGYLLAFPLAAWVTGLVAERGSATGMAQVARLALGGLAGTAVIYAIGVPVLAARIGVTLVEALVLNAAFVPFDAIKLAVVVIVASAVHRAYPGLIRG
jgi:biotin transport system substrate-specific component